MLRHLHTYPSKLCLLQHKPFRSDVWVNLQTIWNTKEYFFFSIKIICHILNNWKLLAQYPIIYVCFVTHICLLTGYRAGLNECGRYLIYILALCIETNVCVTWFIPYFMHIDVNNEKNGLFSARSLEFTAHHGVMHDVYATARWGKGEGIHGMCGVSQAARRGALECGYEVTACIT